MKLNTKDIVLSSSHTYNNNVLQHLSKGEFDAVKSQNNQIVIQKSDKGNSIVIVDRGMYFEKIENFLSHQSKFQKTPTYKLAKYLVPILTNTQSKIRLTWPLKLLSKIPATSWEY